MLTGPTGSGKISMLYCAFSELNTRGQAVPPAAPAFARERID